MKKINEIKKLLPNNIEECLLILVIEILNNAEEVFI